MKSLSASYHCIGYCTLNGHPVRIQQWIR